MVSEAALTFHILSLLVGGFGGFFGRAILAELSFKGSPILTVRRKVSTLGSL